MRLLLAGSMLLGTGACSFAGQIHFGDVFFAGGAAADGFITSFGHHVGIVLH